MSCTRRPGPPGAATWTRTADCVAGTVDSATAAHQLFTRQPPTVPRVLTSAVLGAQVEWVVQFAPVLVLALHGAR
jgi:hypothetical protein